MENQFQDQFTSVADSLLAYLPNLLGGIILILVGLLIGWIAKKILIQLCVILRIDRLIRHTRFESDFSKADVRYGLYHFIGNIGFVIILLIFLDNAFLTWKLKILSDLLSRGILYIPKIIIAILISGAGWLLASWVHGAVLRALHREEIPKASLIAVFVKTLILIFFFAVSLVELDLAREIIIIAFATIFVTLGLIAVVISVIGGKSFFQKWEDSMKDKGKDM